MIRKEYAQARRRFRTHGYDGLFDLPHAVQMEYRDLLDIQNGQDMLAERASLVRCCRRQGLYFNFTHLMGYRGVGGHDPRRLRCTDSRAARRFNRATLARLDHPLARVTLHVQSSGRTTGETETPYLEGSDGGPWLLAPLLAPRGRAAVFASEAAAREALAPFDVTITCQAANAAG